MSTYGVSAYGGLIYSGSAGSGLDYSGSYNGWSFGAGTSAQITSLSGFDDQPNLAPIDTQRLRDHGEFYTDDIAAGRDVTIDLLLVSGGGLLMADLAEAFKAATVPQATPLPLTFIAPGGRSRILYCRPRQRVLPIDVDYQQGLSAAAVQFHANDPRWYDSTLTQVGVTVATGGTGLTMPATMPMSFGGAISGGSATLTNEGNFGTRPTCTITGPCTNPYLQGPGGESLAFSITLGATDTLVVDFSTKTVTLNGAAARYNALAQPFQWWELPPGASTVTFGASLASAGCTATWSFRSAWL